MTLLAPVALVLLTSVAVAQSEFVQQLKPLILESCLLGLSGDHCAFVLCCLCSAGDTTRELAHRPSLYLT